MTALLLDSHVLVWMMGRPDRIGRAARRAIARSDDRGELAVSAITFGEIAGLLARGRLDLGGSAHDIRHRVLREGIVELPLDGEQAIDAGGLGSLPDPMDRFIVAAARKARARLVTADPRILSWNGPVERLDATA